MNGLTCISLQWNRMMYAVKTKVNKSVFVIENKVRAIYFWTCTSLAHTLSGKSVFPIAITVSAHTVPETMTDITKFQNPENEKAFVFECTYSISDFKVKQYLHALKMEVEV